MMPALYWCWCCFPSQQRRQDAAGAVGTRRMRRGLSSLISLAVVGRDCRAWLGAVRPCWSQLLPTHEPSAVTLPSPSLRCWAGPPHPGSAHTKAPCAHGNDIPAAWARGRVKRSQGGDTRAQLLGQLLGPGGDGLGSWPPPVPGGWTSAAGGRGGTPGKGRQLWPVRGRAV